MSEETEKNEAYENVDILYEDDNLIFVKIYSLSAAKYFGPEFLSQRYNYYSKGDLYVIYDKSKDDKFVIYKHNDDHVYIFDDNQDDVNVNDLETKYPKLESLITEIYGVSSIYSALSMIIKGSKIDKYKLSELDNLIGGVVYNSSNPGQSLITLKFDFDEFFGLFDLDNKDDISFLKRLFGYNSYYYDENQFYYYDMGESDWKEGYLINEFNEQNRKKVKELIGFLSPELLTLDGDEYSQGVSKILSNTFDREVTNIISSYVSLKDDCIEETAKEEISSEFSNPFQNYGIFEKKLFREYVTTAKILFSIFKISGKKNGSISDALMYINTDKTFGPYEEYRFEYGCDNFDEESFQNEVERQLEKIEEKMFESDMFADIEGYKEIMQKVLSKYEMGKSFKLPKDKEKFFTIEKIDPKTNRIIGTYRSYKGLTGTQQKRSFSLEEFNNFLYHPELFEQKVLKYVITENQKEKIALNWMNKNYSPDQLEVVKSPKYPDSIFYKKNGKVVMEQDKKYKYFLFDYDEIWSFFQSIFSMENNEIRVLLKIWLEESLKLRGYTPSIPLLKLPKQLEESLKLRGYTPSNKHLLNY